MDNQRLEVMTNRPLAEGRGLIAEQILQTAREHDVHIHPSPELLEVLIRLELGDEIPLPQGIRQQLDAHLAKLGYQKRFCKKVPEGAVYRNKGLAR